MKKITTKKLVMTALFMAFTIIATMFIRIPITFGYVNLGDAFIFLAVFILGPFCGAIVGGVGAGIADLLGFAAYAPGTLVIKSLMAIVTWLIYKTLKGIFKSNTFAEIVAGTVGALVMTAGYFIYEALLFTTVWAAFLNAPWSLLQGMVGVAIAVATMRVLTATKVLNKFKF